jgi:hypothetical protein
MRCWLVGLVRAGTGNPDDGGSTPMAWEATSEAYRRQSVLIRFRTHVEIEGSIHYDVEGRPQLRTAVACAKHADATLVISEIGHMASSTVVMGYLKASMVRFVACDNAQPNEQTIDILVALAADQGRRISLRTRHALAAFKADRRISRRIIAMYPEGVPGEVADAVAGKLGASLPQCRDLTLDARVMRRTSTWRRGWSRCVTPGTASSRSPIP